MRKEKIGPCLALVLPMLIALFTARRANALINAGAEGGIVKRSADSPNNLKLGVGYGVHGEVDLIPLIKLGPYYLHYELAAADRPAPGASDAVFNTLGLRARVTLPIPGSYKPYAYAGAGYTWVNYSPAVGDVTGHFFETPIGVGIAYEVLEIFQLSLDGAYRPGISFGGDAFSGVGSASHPSSGWSLLLGAALSL